MLQRSATGRPPRSAIVNTVIAGTVTTFLSWRVYVTSIVYRDGMVSSTARSACKLHRFRTLRMRREHAFDAAIGNEPHQRDYDVERIRNSRPNERRRDRREAEERRELSLEVGAYR